ncbi:MAG: 50S ribosomal protein L9 [Oscillospiraceae bacterium]
MKVVLRQDIKGTGSKDQIVEVSDGYARNFLFPRKLAVAADATSINDVKNKDASKQHRLDVEQENAKKLADEINDKQVTIKAKSGTGGRLFGAVTAKDIAAAVTKDFGVDIDKRKIVLDADIKAYGIFKVIVKIYPKISATINVNVEE